MSKACRLDTSAEAAATARCLRFCSHWRLACAYATVRPTAVAITTTRSLPLLKPPCFDSRAQWSNDTTTKAPTPVAVAPVTLMEPPLYSTACADPSAGPDGTLNAVWPECSLSSCEDMMVKRKCSRKRVLSALPKRELTARWASCKRPGRARGGEGGLQNRHSGGDGRSRAEAASAGAGASCAAWTGGWRARGGQRRFPGSCRSCGRRRRRRTQPSQAHRCPLLRRALASAAVILLQT